MEPALEQPDLIEQIRTIVSADIIPLESQLLAEGFNAVLPALEAVRQKLREQGLFAPHMPAEYGGMALPLRTFARVSEELGRSPLGHFAFNCAAPDIGNMEVLLSHGSEEQRERWLRPLAAGELRSCFAMTEPEHAGSNPAWMSATAVKDGDDYVIDGHKWFTTAADGAAFAIVMAVTDPAHPKLHRRASQIIVPVDTPGFELV
ncbi:MAG: acyl-CoA dehydrogenase family protein, partial [Caldilineaceae bacterium]|nr:acyl-CoA dehydrogenase family protein [Caldilineaceae bacterium]